MTTKHFAIRTQQRGIPHGMQELLDRFGDLQYDGNGHRIVYFSGTSKKKMEKELGRSFVNKLGTWSNVYKVETSAGDRAITTGIRTDRIRRY